MMKNRPLIWLQIPLSSKQELKRHRALDTPLHHLLDWNKLGLCLLNSHVDTCYVAGVTNSNFDIWRPKCPWLEKEWDKCKLYIDTRVTKVLHQCYTIVLFLSPKFHSVLLYGQQFSNYRPFETSGLNEFENELEHYKVKCTTCKCY